MEINWEVEDGYAGGSRPQSTSFDESDLDHCETWEEAEHEIWNIAEEDFEQKITFYIKNLDELKKWWLPKKEM